MECHTFQKLLNLDLNLQKNPNKSVLLQQMLFGTYQHHSLNTLTCKEPAPHLTLKATSVSPAFVQQRNKQHKMS